ncbi:MAG: type IV secretory system conjugative DNA transfer family protein, partial [Desulfovibrio sp.]|nr:type IV secretory system conjugative DNA transfer family protein [Desulfovibrio sp.]
TIARAYGYHPALGGALFGTHVYAPWMCFIWNSRYAGDAIDQATIQGLSVFFVPFAGLVLYVLMFGRKPKGNVNIHGSARWATLEEIEKMSLLNGVGVYVGGFLHNESILYLRHNGPEHILAFMPTRSGKGVGLILPTLLAWPHSSLVFDIKGENWALTAAYLQSLGHSVVRFDPADDSGATAPYNPLEEIRLNGLQAISDAQKLVQMLLDPDGKSMEGKDAHWKKNAADLLSGVLLHCMITTRVNEKRTANLRDLVYMFGDENRSEKELFAEMLIYGHAEHLGKLFVGGNVEEHKAIGRFIVAAARTILAKPDNERGSVISTAVTDLALYKDPIIARNTRYSSWKIDDLLNHEHPVNLYLVVNPGEIDRLRPLIRIIITQMIYRQTRSMKFEEGRSVNSNKHRVLYLMDEFPALGKIQILESAIAYIAGYGGKMYLIVQDTQQLALRYGKENALMGNCHIRIGAAPNTPEAAEFLSKMTGKTTVVDTKTSLSGSRAGHLKNANVSVQEVARPLLTADECSRLAAPVKDADGNITMPGDMLIFVAGNPPVLGKQILYFKDPVFSDRAKMPPPAVSDRLHVDPDAPAAPAPAEIRAREESIEDKYAKRLAAA